jgi:hypothetical protein
VPSSGVLQPPERRTITAITVKIAPLPRTAETPAASPATGHLLVTVAPGRSASVCPAALRARERPASERSPEFLQSPVIVERRYYIHVGNQRVTPTDMSRRKGSGSPNAPSIRCGPSRRPQQADGLGGRRFHVVPIQCPFEAFHQTVIAKGLSKESTGG